MKTHKKYSLYQQLSCLFEFVYIGYVFQKLVGLTVLFSNLAALYQFRLKLLSVYSYTLLCVYLK